jgi:uncharacterized membrane protein YdbT with pleckstrin-like domain
VDPEPHEQVFFHGHPSWRAILDFYAKGIAAAAVAGIAAGLVTAIVSGHVQVGWIVAVVLVCFLAVLLVGAVKRARTTYTITNERLTIDQGLMSRNVQETRLERIQNVNSRQSLLERLLRVGTVDFDTAAGAEYDFAFRGVANPHEIVRTVDRAIRERREPPDQPGP